MVLKASRKFDAVVYELEIDLGMNLLAHLKRPLRPLKKPIYAMERAYRVRFPGNLRMPDFIGIGAGQSGSSWMFKMLNCHPEVFVARKKETHYFSRKFDEWSLAYYSSLFDEGGDRICGEITPRYSLLLPERIEFIHKIMPDVRLFLIVRNPIDRAWSAARRVMSKLAEQQGISFDQVADSEFYDYFSNESQNRILVRGTRAGYFVPDMLQGHYSRAIDNWTRVFPQEQLLVCFFDDIALDPEGFMRRVFQHIGVSQPVDWNSMPLRKKVNRNPTHDIPERFEGCLRELYGPEIEELRRRFGKPIDSWLS